MLKNPFVVMLISLTALSANAIVGGNDVRAGEVDVSAEVVYLNLLTPNGPSSCTGAYIGDQIVLTAAHCLADYRGARLNRLGQRVSIGVGNYFKQDQRGRDAGSLIEAETYVLGSNFLMPGGPGSRSMNVALNDIALIKLRTPRQTPEGIHANTRAIIVDKAPAEGQPLLSFGFGSKYAPAPQGGAYAGFNGEGLQAMLFVTRERVKQYRTTGFISPKDSVVVTGKDGNEYASLCFGDSGGPAMAKSNGQWLIVGVTSFGSGCRGATALTSVAYHNKWIRAVAAKWKTPLYEAKK